MIYFKIPFSLGFDYCKIDETNTVHFLMYDNRQRSEHISFFLGFIKTTGCLPCTEEEYNKRLSEIQSIN